MGRVWTALVVASFGWGTAGVATRAAMSHGTSPFAAAVYRGLFAAVAVGVFLAVQRRGLPRTAVAWKVGTVMGLSNMAIPFVLSNIALQYASAGFVGLMTALIPILTAVMAHLLLPDERLTSLRLVGLTIALGGVAALLLSGDSGLVEGGRPLLAGLLGLASVSAISYGGVYAKRYSGQYGSLDVSGVHFLTGTVVIVVAMFIAEGAPGAEPAASWVLLIYMGLACTFLPFVLYYWLLVKVSATYAALSGYVVPVVAITAGIVLLDEQLQPGIALGGALILIGVLVTDRSYRRRAATGS